MQVSRPERPDDSPDRSIVNADHSLTTGNTSINQKQVVGEGL